MYTKRITLIIVLLISGNVFAANKADLTFFDRFYEGSSFKFIADEDATITGLRFPAYNDFSFFVDTWQSKEIEAKSYTGRVTKRFNKNFDAALRGKTSYFKGLSNSKMSAAFDIHGNLFGNRAGLGLVLPFDREDSVKISPRYSLGNFTTFLTIGEEKEDLMIGTSYYNKAFCLDVAYSKKDIWYFNLSKGFDIGSWKLCPELRLKFPEGQRIITGFGLLLKFDF